MALPPADPPPRAPWSQGTRPGRHGFPKRIARAIIKDADQCALNYPGCTTLPTQADHTMGYHQAMALGWDPEMFDDPDINGQALCKSCHQIKTAKESNAGRTRARDQRSRRNEPEQHPGITDR